MSVINWAGRTLRLAKLYAQGLIFEEKPDHTDAPVDGYGELWVRNDDPPVLVYTDEDGTDWNLVSELGYRWDDLRFPATEINPPGQASDPSVESTSGLLLFASSGTELIYVLVQMPHAWLEASDIVPHVHWQKTTSASGDVAWRLRYKHSPINEVMDAAWTDIGEVTSPIAGTPDIDTADHHMISSFGTLSMTGKQISDCILFELSRVGGSVDDTYGADARLLEFDIHLQLDSKGSLLEFIK